MSYINNNVSYLLLMGLDKNNNKNMRFLLFVYAEGSVREGYGAEAGGYGSKRFCGMVNAIYRAGQGKPAWAMKS